MYVCMSGSGSDITLNRRDMRSKFGYAMLSDILDKLRGCYDGKILNYVEGTLFS